MLSNLSRKRLLRMPPARSVTGWPVVPASTIQTSDVTPLRLAEATGLRLYPYQQKLVTAWLHPRRIVLKARQVGFSTIVALEALAVVLTHPGATVLLVSYSQDLAANLLRSCYTTLAAYPGAPTPTKQNAFELELPNKARILSQPATRRTGRGFSPLLVVLDEFAYALYAEDIYQSVSPALAASGGRLIIGSTPNGEGNTFADLWHGTDEVWQRTTIPWQDCPVYWTPAERCAHVAADQSAWYREQRPNYSARQWSAEFECDFVGSGDAVFVPGTLEAAEQGALGTQPRQPRRRYVIAVDVGRRNDATVINVVDATATPYQRVYHERMERTPYPVIQQRIAEVQRAYDALLWVESNGVGDPVIENLDVPARPFVTTAKSKVQAIQSLVLLLERGDLKAVWTAQERRELVQYRYDDAGLTQDCVMSLAIAAACLDTGFNSIVAAYQRRAEGKN